MERNDCFKMGSLQGKTEPVISYSSVEFLLWENQDPDNQDLENLEFSENFYNKFCEIKL